MVREKQQNGLTLEARLNILLQIHFHKGNGQWYGQINKLGLEWLKSRDYADFNGTRVFLNYKGKKVLSLIRESMFHIEYYGLETVQKTTEDTERETKDTNTFKDGPMIVVFE